MSAKAVGIGLLAVAAVAAIVLVSRSGGESDSEQIRQALVESIESSKEGRPGSVLDLLSKEFTLNDEAPPSVREIARIVRDARPKVEIANWTAEIRGDTAEMVTDVTLSLSGPFQISTKLPEVHLEFEKESTVKWLVIPAKQWKLKRVYVPASALANFTL
jgi:hypothetical protein